MVVGFYLCNQCLSPLLLWVRISTRARYKTLCDKVCQWLATGQWFSPVSSTNKTDHHDTTVSWCCLTALHSIPVNINKSDVKHQKSINQSIITVNKHWVVHTTDYGKLALKLLCTFSFYFMDLLVLLDILLNVFRFKFVLLYYAILYRALFLYSKKKGYWK